MKYWYILGGVILLVILVLIVMCIIFHIRKKRAIKKVCCRGDCEKFQDLNKALEPYGFAYQKGQDLFYSLMYPWQRDMGYGKIYDKSASYFNMVIDSEPIYFDYDNRHWLIEFWKGQYGLSTGAEIGVYVCNNRYCPFYESVTDEERLQMGFILRKNRKVILRRSDYHWWLTGFVLGEFSHLRELTMEISIIFPNSEMCSAFKDALIRSGYRCEEIRFSGNRISIWYDAPKSKQEYHHSGIRIWFVQKRNKCYCKFYHFITRVFERTLDKLDYLRFCFPRLYKLALCLGHMKKKPRLLRKMRKLR